MKYKQAIIISARTLNSRVSFNVQQNPLTHTRYESTQYVNKSLLSCPDYKAVSTCVLLAYTEILS